MIVVKTHAIVVKCVTLDAITVILAKIHVIYLRFVERDACHVIRVKEPVSLVRNALVGLVKPVM